MIEDVAPGHCQPGVEALVLQHAHQVGPGRGLQRAARSDDKREVLAVRVAVADQELEEGPAQHRQPGGGFVGREVGAAEQALEAHAAPDVAHRLGLLCEGNRNRP